MSPPAFKAAVSGGGYEHSRFDEKKYQDMFAALATAGVAKEDLALAWDFHTASDEFMQSDLLAMRDAAIPAMGANGANLSFTAQPQPMKAGLLK